MLLTIIYDNIQYSKKGWINRNRILVNQKDEYISIPLKKDSDYLNVNQRFLADTWLVERKKILNKIVVSLYQRFYYEAIKEFCNRIHFVTLKQF